MYIACIPAFQLSSRICSRAVPRHLRTLPRPCPRNKILLPPCGHSELRAWIVKVTLANFPVGLYHLVIGRHAEFCCHWKHSFHWLLSQLSQLDRYVAFPSLSFFHSGYGKAHKDPSRLQCPAPVGLICPNLTPLCHSRMLGGG